MSDDFNFDELFSDAASTEAGEATEQEVDIYQQQQENLKNFEEQYKQAETGLSENTIHQIVTSEMSISEQQEAIINAVVTEIGEDSEAVIKVLKELNAKYAELTTVTSETVRAASNLDQASVFTETMQEMANHQEAYSGKADMFFRAISALQAAQTENKGIKDIIAEAKAKRKKHSELKDAMLNQAEAVEKAQDEYDSKIAKQKSLQDIVDDAAKTKAEYTEGREEVKDEQTGDIIQEKINAIDAIEAAYNAESGGFLMFGGERKKQLGELLEANKKIIKDADEVLDDTNIQVTNMEPQIKRAQEALDKAKAELEAQQAEFQQIEDELANDDTIKAVEQVIGNDPKHFSEQAKVFQESGTELIQLMKSDFAHCVDFYADQQENVGQLINVSGNLSNELELIISALRKAETTHEKNLTKLSDELNAELKSIEDEKQAKIDEAEASIEDAAELGDRKAEIEKEYMDLPPLVQKLQDDHEAYQNFLRSYSSRLNQLVSFDQQNTVSLETSKITLNNAKDLALQAESLKNEQIATVSTSTTNATNTVEQLLMETKMHVLHEFGAAAQKTNVLLTNQGVETMIHRKGQNNKNRKGNIENLVSVKQTMDGASAKLKQEAVRSVALSKMETQAVQQLQDSANKLANVTKNSEAEIEQRMQSDEEFKENVKKTGAAMFKPTNS